MNRYPFITHRRFVVFGVILLLASCQSANKSGLTGVWEIEELKITLNSYRGSDSIKVIQTTGAEWEKKMHSRNIQTHYNSDGKYHSVHKNLHDSVVYDPAGTWRLTNDSLIIQDTFPKRTTYRFKLKIQRNRAEFWGLEDFDQDGQADDAYYSRQKKITLK